MTESLVRLDRHARHILLKEIGGPGQQRLARAHVAIVGAGGLGAPAALYLAAAGVGQISLIDPDVVDISNLQRQILFQTKDVGTDKARAGQAAIAALDPFIAVEPIIAKLDDQNGEHLIAGADVVLDGTDNFQTRFDVNKACHKLGVPLVSGVVGRWDGQVSVFASGTTKQLSGDQKAPCYQCWVPQLPPAGETCAQLGVVGALTGVIGTMMALEAIKLLTGAGKPLIGRILLYDGLNATSRTLNLSPDKACPLCAIP